VICDALSCFFMFSLVSEREFENENHRFMVPNPSSSRWRHFGDGNQARILLDLTKIPSMSTDITKRGARGDGFE